MKLFLRKYVNIDNYWRGSNIMQNLGFLTPFISFYVAVGIFSNSTQEFKSLVKSKNVWQVKISVLSNIRIPFCNDFMPFIALNKFMAPE